MKHPFRQRGASTIGILVAVLFFASLLTLVIKLGPVYLDDYTVQGALEGLDGEEPPHPIELVDEARGE